MNFQPNDQLNFLLKNHRRTIEEQLKHQRLPGTYNIDFRIRRAV